MMNCNYHLVLVLVLILVALSSGPWFAPSEATVHPSTRLLAGGLTVEEATLSSDPTVKTICELTSDPETCQSAINSDPEAIFDRFDINDPNNLEKFTQLVHPAIHQICKPTDDPDICVFGYYLSGGTNNGGITNPAVVLDHLMQSTKLLCMRDQKEAARFTEKMQRDEPHEKARLAVYMACSDQFVKAAAQMTLAEEALRKGEIDRAMHNVNQTMLYNDYCDEMLHDRKVTSSIPLHDAGLNVLISSTEALHSFASNCMSLLEILTNHANKPKLQEFLG